MGFCFVYRLDEDQQHVLYDQVDDDKMHNY